MQKTTDTVTISPEMVYHRFNEIYWSDVMKLAFDGIISADVDACSVSASDKMTENGEEKNVI